MNAEDFKPGDLAIWRAPNPMRPQVVEYDGTEWWCSPYARLVDPSDLLHVLAPNEQPARKGSVNLDPEDEGQVLRLSNLLVQMSREHLGENPGTACNFCIAAALQTLAAEQNAPAVPEPPQDALLVDESGGVWRWRSDAWDRVRDNRRETWPDVHREFGPLTVYRPEVDQ